jgi:hypothetical protein
MELLLQRLADAREAGDAALARQRTHRDRRVTDRLGRVAVGDHAVHDGPVELVEVTELVEGGGDGRVGRVGHGLETIRP